MIREGERNLYERRWGHLRTTTMGLSLPETIISVFQMIKAVDTMSPKEIICSRTLRVRVSEGEREWGDVSVFIGSVTCRTFIRFMASTLSVIASMVQTHS